VALLLRGGSELHKRSTSAGFALPTILIASVVMLIVLLVSVGSTTAVRTAIKDQYYQQLAQAAGEAGVAYAEACLNANGGVPLWTDASPLKPNTDCSGTELVSCPTTSTDPLCSIALNGNIRSSFSMGKPVVETPEVLVVGGGGGGAAAGSGGGAGGYVYSPSHPLSVGPHPVTIGGGGAGGVYASSSSGVTGGNSVFSTITAVGGGGGRTHGGGDGWPGGSGGGGSIVTTGTTPNGGIGSQGNNGGAGLLQVSWIGNSGGGGGAGSAGIAGGNVAGSGNGGNGIANSISGSSIYYAAGGGGGEISSSFVGAGGTNGGGSANVNAAGNNATANRGGGGGGGSYNGTYFNGGNGGSGIVIISYPTGLLDADGGTETTVNGKRIHTFTSDGTFTVNSVTNAVKTLPNTGYVEVLRTSTNAVWRRYEQKAAPASVVPDLCSGAAKSIYGWNNATVVESTKSLPGYTTDAIAVGVGSLNPGPVYFRKDFSITQGGTYDLSGVAGATFNAFIDGQLIISNGVAATTQTTTLTAGCHTIEVKSLNGTIQPNDFDLKMVLVKSGSTIPIVKTDGSWRAGSGGLVHFSSPDYYVSSSWGAVRNIQAFNDTTPVWTAAPSPAWNTTSGGNASARWISTTHSYTSTATYPANSTALFRDDGTFTISSPTNVRLTFACDDVCQIWLNGNQVATGAGWASTETVTTTLAEGTYQFGISLQNGGAGGSGFLFSAVDTGNGTTLSRSGPGWSAANEWYPTASNPSAFSYSTAYTPNPNESASAPVDLLVVGGGGAGGVNHGGGGGGGGLVYQSGYQLTSGSYSVVVGAGGPSGTTAYETGFNGSNSMFGLLTALGGGGGGGRVNTNVVSQSQQGGSGGGGAGTIDALTGIAGAGANNLQQGSNGGNGSSDATAGQGGGGGGAGAAGGNASGANTTGVSGAGGNGLAYSITGASVYYAGGGSGGRWGAGSVGAPGLGGGGTGGAGSAVGSAGTANTGGGGGGGAGSDALGGAGGSGVVIISYPTGSITATGGTITTSGGNTIHRFTSSGTFIVTSIN
jgi:hypothetical protein